MTVMKQIYTGVCEVVVKRIYVYNELLSTPRNTECGKYLYYLYTHTHTHSQALQPMQGLGRIKKPPPIISISGPGLPVPDSQLLCILRPLRFRNRFFLQGQVVNLLPNPQPGGPGCLS